MAIDNSSLMSEIFPAIDPLAPLALSIQANRRVFALFLGSGLSVSAGIPTGRDVVHLLIRKLACARGQECGDDPEAWFNAEFKDDPDYSKLLETLYPSASERRNALNDLFEPGELDQIHGRKRPTQAHHSITQLVKQGFFQVILTTNFDRLLEQAFTEANVPFTMVRSSEEAERIDPLQHIQTLIIKVNGDYKDPDIRNTTTEVSVYPAGMEKLLKKVFTEYGLIICGWSSTSDIGLRGLLTENLSRYTTYWATRGEIAEKARPIVMARQGVFVTIEDANVFFSDLEMKVAALDRMAHMTPLTASMAAEQVKFYLSEERWDIALNDLVVRETRSVSSRLLSMNDLEKTPKVITLNDYGLRIQEYDSVLSSLVSMVVAGSFWGRQGHNSLWGSSLKAVLDTVTDSGTNTWIQLQWYPALRLLYASGISALASKNYNLLRTLLVDTKVSGYGIGNDIPAVMKLFPFNILKLDNDVASRVLRLNYSSSMFPLSDKLREDLSKEFTDIVMQDAEFLYLFDYFEYLCCLVHADYFKRQSNEARGSFSSFIQRSNRGNPHNPLLGVENEIKRDGANWAPLQAGFFEGSLERARQIKHEYDERLVEIRKRY
ncbi:SIR2 family protein [Methanosphaerula subterraneus]|uniref:SIR2 family protein n=1 Tax=Methanosphaerula subterraneus TaxID=3350244 RepID=UPI003F87FDC8